MFRLQLISRRTIAARHSSRTRHISSALLLLIHQRINNFAPLGETPRRRFLSITRSLTMASDEDYMAFLNKANRDVSGGGGGGGNGATASSKNAFKATDAGSEAPTAIVQATKDAVYTSDADEPFEVVNLKYDGDSLPNEVEFGKLIQHWDPDNADIEIRDPMDWDRKGNYTKLLDAVREATKGNDVRVYRVARDATRAEYWLVSRAEGRIVGTKALAVES